MRTCSILACSLLLQAAWASEQRLQLRARAREATPLITLPESLLLQSNAGQQQHEEATASSAFHSGFWHALQESAGDLVEDAREAFFNSQDAGQDPKRPVCKDVHPGCRSYADQGLCQKFSGCGISCNNCPKATCPGITAGDWIIDYDTSPMKVQVDGTGLNWNLYPGGEGAIPGVHQPAFSGTFTVSEKPDFQCVMRYSDGLRKDYISRKKDGGFIGEHWMPGTKYAGISAIAQVVQTTPVPTTTMTTVDPNILAQQLKVTADKAKARNLLVAMIDRAQLGLMGRLKDIDLDLDALKLRAQHDLKAVNHSYQIAEKMPIMASNAEIDVAKIKTNGDKMQKDTLPAIMSQSTAQSNLIEGLMKEKKELEGNVKKGEKIPGAKTRVQDNTATLDTIVPRLEKLERRVTHLEGRLYDGDLKKLVDDTASKEVTNIVEDVSRGFGRFVENPV